MVGYILDYKPLRDGLGVGFVTNVENPRLIWLQSDLFSRIAVLETKKYGREFDQHDDHKIYEF